MISTARAVVGVGAVGSIWTVYVVMVGTICTYSPIGAIGVAEVDDAIKTSLISCRCHFSSYKTK